MTLSPEVFRKAAVLVSNEPFGCCAAIMIASRRYCAQKHKGFLEIYFKPESLNPYQHTAFWWGWPKESTFHTQLARSMALEICALMVEEENLRK